MVIIFIPLFGVCLCNLSNNTLNLFLGGIRLSYGDFVSYYDHTTSTTRLGRIRQIFDDRTCSNDNELNIRVGLNPLYYLEELDKIFQKNRERRIRSQKEKVLYLDERNIFHIDIGDLISRISCTFAGESDNPPNREFVVYEILYYSGGKQKTKIKPAHQRHLLHSEIRRPNSPPHEGMRQFKFFLDVYIDEFATSRWIYHNLGGVYIVIGNMSLKERQKLRNIYLLGFVPFGATFEDFIKLFAQEMKELELGVKMVVRGIDHWVIACKYFSEMFTIYS